MNKKKKFLLAVLLALPLLAGGAYAVYGKYVIVRHANLIRRATQFLASGNQKKAMLCVERALRYNPDDVEACRLRAELEDANHSPGALIWRKRVLNLAPHSLSDQLALAQTALKMRDLTTAANVLESVDDAGRNTAAYQNAAGEAAANANHFPAAEAHFLEALRLDPDNAALQLSLAVVRLHETNTTSMAESRNVLKRLSASPAGSDLRCKAIRELVMDALHQGQTESALAFSRQLMQETNAIFTDRLLQLEVLRTGGDAGFAANLASAEREISKNPGNAYELALWEMRKISPAAALKWTRGLPEMTQTNQSVALLIAECETTVGNWPGLCAFLERQNWSDLEFVRHAFLARGMRGQELTAAAGAQWESALKKAGGHKENLVMLLRLAAQWKWLSEGEDILWAIVNNFPDEQWAVRALSQDLFENGRTRSLMQLYSQESRRYPADLMAKNNLAMTALLLDAQELKPHDLALEVYQQAPTNASYASTYAFSLHRQKRDAEALKILEKFNPEELDQPGISGYYGIILRAMGNGTKAEKYLNSAGKSPLLPEEHKLFEQPNAGA